MNARKANHTVDKVRQLQRKLYLAAKKNSKRRFHALYDKVYREDILFSAWKRVKANKGAAGIDGQTIERIVASGEEEFIREIQKTLREGKYRPQPVRRRYIPKGNGEKRPLGIPVIKDRVVQMAVKIVIEPIFEADFKECSFGFRPRKDAHQALDRVRKACNNGGWWVVDLDIRKYFDSINHPKLMLLVQQRISDRRILKLIRQWLEAGIMEDGVFTPSDLGSPQGGVISPLLANIYLHYLDFLWEKHLSRRGVFTRYADDAVIVCRNRKDALAALEAVRSLLHRLELQLHPEKTRLVNLWDGKEGFDFLGFHHHRAKARTKSGRGYYTTQQWPSAKAMQKMRQGVKDLLAPRLTLLLPVRELIQRLNPVLRGWRNYYGLPYARKKLGQIDYHVLLRLTIWLNRKKQRKGRHQRSSEAYRLSRALGLERLAVYSHAPG